jgi:uncharacterized protein (TIGR02453 family)
MSGFQGFPKEAFTFLAGLAGNNTKTWFDAHRSVYEEAVVAPALALVAELGARLKKRVPSLRPEPRIGGSLFRIHRDTRFSADKSPYKTHVGIRLRDSDTARSAKCSGPLFYIELNAASLRIGAGVKEFDPSALETYRRAVAGKSGAAKIGAFIREAESRGHQVAGDVLTRVPPVYAGQKDNALLRRKGLFVMEQSPLPKIVHRPDFAAYCEEWFTPYVPLFAELRRLALAG